MKNQRNWKINLLSSFFSKINCSETGMNKLQPLRVHTLVEEIKEIIGTYLGGPT